MVNSRIFEIPVNGENVCVLCPIADMLNHMSTTIGKKTKLVPQTTYGYDQNLQCFYLKANQDIAFGEPILDTYGNKYTSNLFMGYGFVLSPHYLEDIKI